MKIKKLIPIILSVCLLTSCTSSTNDSADSTYQSETELEYKSLDEVKADITSVKTEYENMTVDTEALNALAEKFPEKADTVMLKQVSDFDEKYDTLRPLFISDDEYSEEYFQGWTTDIPPGYVYDDGEQYFNVCSNGGIGLSVADPYEYEVVERFYVDRDYEDKEYVLSGEKYSVSEAVKYVNSFLDTLMENGCGEMRIGYVEVQKYSDNYKFYFHIQRTAEGMELNRFWYLDAGNEMYPRFDVDIEMTEPDKINEFLGDVGFCTIDEVIDTPTEYVTLQSALNQCEYTLASNHTYEVKEIGFGYLPEIRKANGSTWDESVDGNFYFQCGTTYYAEPGWFIWLDTTKDYECMVFVNAVTGEPTILFNNAEDDE